MDSGVDDGPGQLGHDGLSPGAANPHTPFIQHITIETQDDLVIPHQKRPVLQVERHLQCRVLGQTARSGNLIAVQVVEGDAREAGRQEGIRYSLQAVRGRRIFRRLAQAGEVLDHKGSGGDR